MFQLFLLLFRLSVALSFNHYNYDAYRIARGNDAPEGSHKFLGRLQFSINLHQNGKDVEIVRDSTGYFVAHQGANGKKKFYFVTAAHVFDLKSAGLPTADYTKPAKIDNLQLISEGKIAIYHGSVKREDQKSIHVYPNGRYKPSKIGEAHLVRVPIAFNFTGVPGDPNADMATIQLTLKQKTKVQRNGGKFLQTKDDSTHKTTEKGEDCIIAGWGSIAILGYTRGTILQEANVTVNDVTYCTDQLDPNSVENKVVKGGGTFACFSTDFGKINYPLIRKGDSGAPIMCGVKNEIFFATHVTQSAEFLVMGPTRETIMAFLKDSYYDT